MCLLASLRGPTSLAIRHALVDSTGSASELLDVPEDPRRRIAHSPDSVGGRSDRLRLDRLCDSACAFVLFDDALCDLQDGLFVLRGGLSKQPLGLLAGAVLTADEKSRRER